MRRPAMAPHKRLARFHAPDVEGQFAAGLEIELPASEAHHAVRVLRLGVGDELIVFDGEGQCASATVVAAEKRRVVVRLGEAAPCAPESPIAVKLAFALSKGEKPDWIIRRAVELGVAIIQPLESRRSVVRLEGERGGKRLGQWQAAAVEACKQCERARVPLVAPLISFADLAQGCGDSAVFMLEARDADEPLSGALESAKPRLPKGPFPWDERPAITLIAGPEGGWDPEELAQAREAGWRLCSLGPRVLRAETACLAMLTVAQTVLGDFASSGNR